MLGGRRKWWRTTCFRYKSLLSSIVHTLFLGYGIEHAQCVPPSEFSEPSFITESYQTLHPISSEELLSLKYENDYPSVILRDPLQTDTLQTDYFAIKQEVVTPDNMCMGRTSRGRSDFFSGSSWVSKNYLTLWVFRVPFSPLTIGPIYSWVSFSLSILECLAIKNFPSGKFSPSGWQRPWVHWNLAGWPITFLIWVKRFTK